MMIFRQLIDSESRTYTYVIGDANTRWAAIIDPVLDQVDRDSRLIEELDLDLRYVLDTHAHADHVTAASALRERFGARTAVSRHAGVEGADRQLDHGDVFFLGNLAIGVLETPGHTHGCVTYCLHTAGRLMVFTGDALLIRGCGRTDFQQGDARRLYRSVRDRIYTLPDSTLIYPGHDYAGFTSSTVAEEKRWNARLAESVSEDSFVKIMEKLTLPRPRMIDVAVPANLVGGRLS